MTEFTDPQLPQREPEVIVYSLLREHWDESNITGRFETDSQGRPKWLHTGWYVDNPHAQVSVTPRNEGPEDATETGWTGIDSTGRGPVATIDGQVDVNVWVPHDSTDGTDGTGYEKTGVNPKKLAGELKREVVRIIDRHAGGTEYNGQRELTFLGIGRITSPSEPDDTDVENRYLIPVFFGYFKGRE